MISAQDRIAQLEQRISASGQAPVQPGTELPQRQVPANRVGCLRGIQAAGATAGLLAALGLAGLVRRDLPERRSVWIFPHQVCGTFRCPTGFAVWPLGGWRSSEGVTVLVQEVIECFAQQARFGSVGRRRELR